MATQIERNAEVVADLAGADWQVAYVIACSVEVNGKGRPSGEMRNSAFTKVPALEFARMVKAAAGGSVYGLGRDGIVARLRKWDEFAAEWDIPLSADLKPADAKQYPAFPDIPFARQDGTAGDDEGNKSKVKDIKNNAAAVAAALEDPDFADKVIRQTTPEAKDAVRGGFANNPTPVKTKDGIVVPEPRRKQKTQAGEILNDIVPNGHVQEAAQHLALALADAKKNPNWNTASVHFLNKCADYVAELMSTVDMSTYDAAIAAGLEK